MCTRTRDPHWSWIDQAHFSAVHDEDDDKSVLRSDNIHFLFQSIFYKTILNRQDGLYYTLHYYTFQNLDNSAV